RLLELQRNRMLMYTSCGWFFDELSGLEPVQVLRYAALVTQYARELGGGALEDEFVRRLKAAPTNVPAMPDGAEVYRRLGRPATYEAMKADLLARYTERSMVDMVRGMDTYFRGESYDVRHLFLEGRRSLIADVTRAALERHEESFRHVWEETRKLVRYLREVDAPVPEALALAGRHVMETEARTELDRAARLGSIPPRVFELVDEAAALDLPLDLRPCRPVLRAAVAAALTRVAESPVPERVAAVLALIEGARRLRVGFDRWSAQNRLFDLWRKLPEAHAVLAPLAEALEF